MGIGDNTFTDGTIIMLILSGRGGDIMKFFPRALRGLAGVPRRSAHHLAGPGNHRFEIRTFPSDVSVVFDSYVFVVL